jgi:chaperonin GroEL
MAATVVTLGTDARQLLARGVEIAADLVATTMGPAGRAVLVGRTHAPPLLLRNGYTIVQHLDLSEPELQAGVLTMRELAWRTSDQVGDGTSTTIVMARALMRAGAAAFAAGIPSVELQDAIDEHCAAVLRDLAAAKRSDPTAEELRQVAIQAAGGDAGIGALIAGAHHEAGPDGVVAIEEGRGTEDHVRVDPGLHFDQGWISPHFVTDQASQMAEIDDPLILLHLGPISELDPIVPALEMIAKADRALLLIAENVTGNALSTLILNKQRAGLKVAVVKAAGTGVWREQILTDIAIATGATVIGEPYGTSLEHLRPQMAGRAAKVSISRTGTTIVGGRGNAGAIAARVQEIRDAIAREKHLDYDRDMHRRRLARLQGSIATVSVGGMTESEIADRLGRAKTASAAVAAARKGGVVAGGSAAFIHAGRRAASSLPPGLVGRVVGTMFEAALHAPVQAIAGNAGADGRAVAHRLVEEPSLCFDALTRSFVAAETLTEPSAVLETALLNSVSAASRLVGVAAAIAMRRVGKN